MTYGYWLDRAAAALAAAAQASPARARGHPDVAAAVAARARVYAQLRRLHAHLAPGLIPGPTSPAVADQVASASRERTPTTTARLLGVGLSAATVDPPTIAPAPTAPQPAIARDLAEAADAIGMAADVLASHLGPRHRRPRTPQGQAIAAGAGQPGGMADLARLAHAAAEIDRRLIGWISHGTPAATLRPVYEPVLIRLRWWTRSRYPRLLDRIAVRGQRADGESILRLLEVAPATEPATGPQPVASLHDTLKVLDSSRAWLHQHPDQPSYAHIVAATRLALTITALAERLPTPEPAHATAWRQVARQLDEFAGLDGRMPDRLAEELGNASRWLRDHLGRPTAEGNAHLNTLVQRLPGLAHQLDLTLTAAVRRGRLCVAHHKLDRSTSRGILRAEARWRLATLADPPVHAVRRTLDAIATGSPPTGRGHSSCATSATNRSAYPNPPGEAGQSRPLPAAARQPSTSAQSRRR